MPDCLNCGHCESCIDRSIAAWEEHEQDDRSEDGDFCGCQQDECPHCNRWCHYCGGDGWGISGDSWPVDDPVNDCPGEVEECPCCHGSGLAKDCTFW